MSKTPLLIATAFALCATTLIADQAEARERSRAVQRTAQGGSVAVERSNARFDSQRQRGWQADGQGNASGARSGSATGAYGGHADYQQSAYRNADGSAGRQGSAHVDGRNGGTATVSGGVTPSRFPLRVTLAQGDTRSCTLFSVRSGLRTPGAL